MYCDLLSQYIQVPKLFKGGNYSRVETIRGNTVSNVDLQNEDFNELHVPRQFVSLVGVP